MLARYLGTGIVGQIFDDFTIITENYRDPGNLSLHEAILNQYGFKVNQEYMQLIENTNEELPITKLMQGYMVNVTKTKEDNNVVLRVTFSIPNI